jgi:xylulokinase
MTGQRIGHWLSLQDWMVWMLTRVLKSSPGSAMRLGVLDIHHPWKYAPDVLELAGIAPNTLPPLANFKQVLGHVCHQASQETGLQQGTPVFPAPGDQPAAFAGSGALPQGAALASLGTSFLVSFAVDRFVPARAGGQYTLEVLPDGLYTLELGEGAGTNVLDWLRVNLLDIPSIKMLNELAAASPPGANDLHVIPHWWAILDEQRSGRIDGLRSHHTRADIVRAALESLVYELRHAWDKLVAASGISPQQIVVCGGAASNLILCQIIADVFACPILKPVTNEASALGAAISATLGLGWFETLDQAARVFSHCQATLEPDASNVTFYQSAYQDYLTRLT